MKVLWVESDTVFKIAQTASLSKFGYYIEIVSNLEEAVFNSKQNECTVVVYDCSFEKKIDIKSISLLFEKNIPVLTVLGDSVQVDDKVTAYNGSESVVRRPISCDEFISKLRAVFGKGIKQNSSSQYSLNGLVLDESRFEVIDEIGKVTSLTRSELRLLRVLLLYPERVFTKDELKKTLSPDGNDTKSNNIEVHIRNLRKKLGEYRIRTLWGRGYTIARPQIDIAAYMMSGEY